MCIYVKIHVSGCRIPDALCSILSSLSPSLSRTFRDVAFFFRGIHVSEIHFRGLSWKILKEFPMFPGKHILKHLFPACHAKVSKFYQSCMPPIASSSSSSSFTSSSSTPPSTASQSSVGTAGLQPRAPDFSGHCRAPTATARSQWVQPDTASARSQWALPLSIEWGGAIPAS